jgi:tellurite resistance protein TerA
MAKETLSLDSLSEATRTRAQFSGHGGSKGAQGFKVITDNPDCEFLSHSGQTSIINPHENGFGKIVIGAAWDVVQVEKQGFIDRIFKKTRTVKQNVDIDLGCLYEMHDGTRGCIQAFGDLNGDFDNAPYILFSGDERTGDKEGHDEHLDVNGAHWDKIKRMLVYVYIYRGVPNWSVLKPQIQVLVPDEHPMIVTLDAHMDELAVCAVAMIENVRNGIRLTNHTEYFPGHAEMDRAFGFGLEWADGKKY